MTVTGERVSTAAGGFNPTWQRHVAAYALIADLLPPGRVLDLGCGVGHSYQRLAPRETVGVDVDAAALEGQEREVVVSDMRDLPFPDRSFASVVAVQSIEHVPDPERVLRETVRVLEPGGTAVFVTPNRLTFSPSGEIVDPYHYVEYAPAEFERMLRPWFESVELGGLFGSERYLRVVAAERRRLERLLRLDPMRLRRLLPRSLRQRLYDRRLRAERVHAAGDALAIRPEDFRLKGAPLEESLDLVGVGRTPRA